MFKNQRTSTKLFLLCAMFIGAIVLATYSLIQEKQIAIEFVRKEIVGARYLDALRGVYPVILAEPGAPLDPSADTALHALDAAETEAAGVLQTNELEEAVSASVRKLAATGSVAEKHPLLVESLDKARQLATMIGDKSNLTLDPDLDSYYLQNISVKQVPVLLAQMGELQSLLRSGTAAGAAPSGDVSVRPLLLDGMIRSTMVEIERAFEGAYRGEAGTRLRQAIGAGASSTISAVHAYLEAVKASLADQDRPASLTQSYETAVGSVLKSWAESQTELKTLLDKRLANLTGNLRNSLVLNGLVAGLSILFAVIAYRQIVPPLRALEDLAGKVSETKDYTLRMDVERRDEIGQLALAFNDMLAELDAARGREASDQARTAAMQAELARVARLTTMGEMAASIAHEINQPLAAIVNNANAGLRWLKNEPPNVEEVQAALKRMVNDGTRASEIIASIRAMLKKSPQSKVEVDPNGLIREVMRLTQREFQNRGVEMRPQLTPGLPPILADRVQLQQVLLNLFMNGVEAMLAVQDRERVLSVRSERHNGFEVLLVVEDTGIGIAPEDARRVFEAFFTTKPDGMGMGLSICRSIVEAHGGRISATPGVPHGSVFQIVLPGEREGANQ